MLQARATRKGERFECSILWDGKDAKIVCGKSIRPMKSENSHEAPKWRPMRKVCVSDTVTQELRKIAPLGFAGGFVPTQNRIF
jgi:hypothetical protein